MIKLLFLLFLFFSVPGYWIMIGLCFLTDILCQDFLGVSLICLCLLHLIQMNIQLMWLELMAYAAVLFMYEYGMLLCLYGLNFNIQITFSIQMLILIMITALICSTKKRLRF